MKAKVIRVRCSKCRAQQEFFFRIIGPTIADPDPNDPQLTNALDPKCPDPHFFLRNGQFLHVPLCPNEVGCQSTKIKAERRPDVRICPVCLRPNPDEPNRGRCKWQDCRAIFIKLPVESGSGSHHPRRVVVNLGGVQ